MAPSARLMALPVLSSCCSYGCITRARFFFLAQSSSKHGCSTGVFPSTRLLMQRFARRVEDAFYFPTFGAGATTTLNESYGLALGGRRSRGSLLFSPARMTRLRSKWRSPEYRAALVAKGVT